MYLALKRLFIDIDGIEFCLQLYRSAPGSGLKRKIIALLEDLLLYDQAIGGPEEIILTEQDKNILKGKASKHLDLTASGQSSGLGKADENMGEKQVTDNKKYTNIAKKKLFEGDFLSLFLEEAGDGKRFFETFDSQERARLIQTAKVVYLCGVVEKKQMKVDTKVRSPDLGPEASSSFAGIAPHRTAS